MLLILHEKNCIKKKIIIERMNTKLLLLFIKNLI